MKKLIFSAIVLLTFNLMWSVIVKAQNTVSDDSTKYRKRENTGSITAFVGIQEDKPFLGLSINWPIGQKWSIPSEIFLWNTKEGRILRLSVSAKYRLFLSDYLILCPQGGVGLFFYMIPPFVNLGVGVEQRLTQSINFVVDVRVLRYFDRTTESTTPIFAIGVQFR